MKSLLVGGMVAFAAAGGVGFVLVGAGNTHHCGPCLTTLAEPVVAPASESEYRSDVTDTMELQSTYTRRLPQAGFISFDEPPYANPGIVPVGAVVPATFIAPIIDDDMELAPMPRPVTGIRLMTASDRF